MSDYRKTKLYDSHQSLKAKLVPFSGFWMPLQYSSIIKEHHHVRSKSGLFDVSHMGEFIVSGNNAKTFLQNVTTPMIFKNWKLEKFNILLSVTIPVESLMICLCIILAITTCWL